MLFTQRGAAGEKAGVSLRSIGTAKFTGYNAYKFVLVQSAGMGGLSNLDRDELLGLGFPVRNAIPVAPAVPADMVRFIR